MIRYVLLAIIAAAVSGCWSEEALVIVRGPNADQLIVTNDSSHAVSYYPVLLDHPLDIWNLAAGKQFQGQLLTGFVLFLVDGSGARHLRCGSKDGPPPGQRTILTLARHESVRFAHAPMDKFTSCGRALKGPLRWQVVTIRIVVSRDVNLAKTKTFSILSESNLIDADNEAGIVEHSVKE